MNFVSVRFITGDIKRLVSFYERITGLTATWYTDDFAEVSSPTCTLAIGSTRTMPMFGAAAPPIHGQRIGHHRVSRPGRGHNVRSVEGGHQRPGPGADDDALGQ